MARVDAFTGLSELLAVARHRSFRAAAAELRVTPAAVSQAIRALEARVGLPLFQRTTRRVALTEAGTQLLSRLRPAATDITEALDALATLRQRPAGNLRLSVPRIALDLVVYPVLPELRRAYPEVTVEIDVNDASVDLIAEGFDAGIRIGDFVERDMVAVRVSGEQRAAIVASPAYLDGRGTPRTPRDLTEHRCINFRRGSSGVYRWEFEKGSRSMAVAVQGPLVVNDAELMMRAALDGVGLAFSFEDHVAPDLASGRLVRVLEDWCAPFPGYFLYYPSRRQQPPALSALIETLRLPPPNARRPSSP